MSKFLKSNNKKGNTVVTFEGNLKLLERLLDLQESGELEKILGFAVLEIDASAIAGPKSSLDVKMPSFSKLLNDISLRNTSVYDWVYDIGMQASRLVRRFMPNNNIAVAVLRGDATTNNPLDNIVSKLPTEWLSDIGLDLSQNTTEYIVISLLNSSNLDCIKFIAYEIGGLTNVPADVIDTLATCITTIEDSETRWQLALTLGKLDPEHSLGAVGQRKKIQLAGNRLELFLALRVNKDDLIDVLLQVYNARKDYLPVGLQVFLLDETDEIFSEEIAKDEDKYLTLEFTGASGQFFSIKVSLDEHQVNQNFLI